MLFKSENTYVTLYKIKYFNALQIGNTKSDIRTASILECTYKVFYNGIIVKRMALIFRKLVLSEKHGENKIYVETFLILEIKELICIAKFTVIH